MSAINMFSFVRIPGHTLALSATILCAYFVEEKYFSLGDYYLLPVTTITISLYSILIRIRKIGTCPRGNFSALIALFYIILSSLFHTCVTADVVASYLLILTFFYFTTNRKYSYTEIRWLIFAYVGSAAILSFILFYQLRMPYLGRIRFSVFYSDLDFYDVNFLASYLLLPALLSFYIAWIKPLFGCSFLFKLLNILIVSSILATGSRAAMIGIIIGFFPLIYNHLKSWKLYIGLLLIIVSIFFCLPVELQERLFIDSYNDGSQTRRFDDWLYGVKAVCANPIWGSGIASTSTIIHNLFRVNITAHNTYLALFINCGIIGSLPILYILLLPLFKCKNTFLHCYYLSFYIAFLFNIAIIEAITSFVFLIPLVMFYIIRQNNCVYE